VRVEAISRFVCFKRRDDGLFTEEDGNTRDEVASGRFDFGRVFVFLERVVFSLVAEDLFVDARSLISSCLR